MKGEIDVPVKRWTLFDLVRRQKGETDLERLTRPNPLLVDAPYAGPPAFVDPLQQLELGRDPVAFIETFLGVLLEPWQRSVLRDLCRPGAIKNFARPCAIAVADLEEGR